MSLRNIEDLLDILACPNCHHDGGLVQEKEEHDFQIKIKLSDSHLHCKECSSHYPITEDGIPILWSENLKSAFMDINNSDDLGEVNLSANMKIYDSISDDYQAFTRQGSATGIRLRSSVKRIFESRNLQNKLHLDFACGPGHVIEWLSGMGFKQVGIDVSLENLRNAKKGTGCLVVCGDACLMPFKKDAFDLVTESSGLHHILDWKQVLLECGRICKSDGGIVIDCEPSTMQMAWSPLAIFFFNLRFPVYKLLSYFIKDKYIFRDTEEAKLNLEAEIHHQPGTGFPLEELSGTFDQAGFQTDVIVSPTVELGVKATPTWKRIVLNLLSARNPWNPNYGNFMAIAYNKSSKSE